jgi:hypothetical protein
MGRTCMGGGKMGSDTILRTICRGFLIDSICLLDSMSGRFLQDSVRLEHLNGCLPCDAKSYSISLRGNKLIRTTPLLARIHTPHTHTRIPKHVIRDVICWLRKKRFLSIGEKLLFNQTLEKEEEAKLSLIKIS